VKSSPCVMEFSNRISSLASQQPSRLTRLLQKQSPSRHYYHQSV